MNKPVVTVVDYGIGNLYSVQRALETCGAEVRIATHGDALAGANHVVLPGVGAFADGMAGLREGGFVEPLRAHAARGLPLLGICLGMQMLASTSEEFGQHEGLGLIAGRVVPILPLDRSGARLKIPSIGWADLDAQDAGRWNESPLRGVAPGTAVYLVHSFHVEPSDERDIVAYYDYGGQRVTAAIGSGNVFGFQFHPEKSAAVGLRILDAFLHAA